MDTLVPISLLVTSLLIGMALQRVRAFPDNTHVVLNQYVIYIALPALALIHIPEVAFQADLLFPVATSWIVFLVSILFVTMCAKIMGWDRSTTGCLILTVGLGNTAFVGYPVVEALYGSEALKVALLVDQPGTFVVVSTLGVIVASIYATGKTRKRVIFWRVITFPPFIIFVIALGMNLAGIHPGGVPLGVLEQLSGTLTPIALISVGLQLRFSIGELNIKPLFYGLTYKLILAPALLFVLYILLFRGSGLAVEVSIIQAAMPPMITGAILAMTFGLNPRLASILVGIGVPLSFFTLALWYYFLSWYL